MPGTVVLVGSCDPFLRNQVSRPRDVLAVLGIGVDLALLAAADRDGGCPDHPVDAIISG
ncbi:MAG: hypothetical protein M3Y71_01180 [Actinomycetota bacterium]|nr:hypothetical protein [Actinomycetota bacterium]